MATARNVTTNPPRQPLSGNRPFPAGKDAAYDALLGRVAAVMRQADVLEEIWLQDVVDASWEMVKLWRMKARFTAIDDVEQLDRLTAAAELRRDTALHEIAVHWSTLVAQLDRATSDIEHAEVEGVPSRPVMPAERSA